jgi:hypothetical protein
MWSNNNWFNHPINASKSNKNELQIIEENENKISSEISNFLWNKDIKKILDYLETDKNIVIKNNVILGRRRDNRWRNGQKLFWVVNNSGMLIADISFGFTGASDLKKIVQAYWAPSENFRLDTLTALYRHMWYQENQAQEYIDRYISAETKADMFDRSGEKAEKKRDLFEYYSSVIEIIVQYKEHIQAENTQWVKKTVQSILWNADIAAVLSHEDTSKPIRIAHSAEGTEELTIEWDQESREIKIDDIHLLHNKKDTPMSIDLITSFTSWSDFGTKYGRMSVGALIEKFSLTPEKLTRRTISALFDCVAPFEKEATDYLQRYESQTDAREWWSDEQDARASEKIPFYQAVVNLIAAYKKIAHPLALKAMETPNLTT